MHNYFSIPNIISSIFCLAIGVFTLHKNPQARLNKIFFIQATSACLWQFGTFMVLISENASGIDFWARFTYIGAIFIPVATFHLAAELLQKNILKKFVLLGYALGLFVFLPLSRTEYFISGTYKYYWGPWFKVGVAHPIYLTFFVAFMLAGFACLYFSYRNKSAKLEKIRLIYLFTAYIIAYTGVVDFLPDYGIEVFPFGSVSVFLYILIVSYAIVKYRLMDIAVALKRTVIFAGLFSFITFVLIGFTYLIQLILNRLIGVGQWLVLIFSAPVIVFTMEPLKRFLTNITDRVLFQKKYDYQQTLKEASEGMTLVTDIKKLLNLVVRVVSKSIRVKSAAIFQLDEAKNRYVLKIRRGTSRRHTGYFLSKDNVLVWWLQTHKETLLYDELEDWLRSERLLRKEKGLKERLVAVREEMLAMDSVICVPSFGRGKLIGFLILGEKLSGDIYTPEDVHLLSTLASEAAIAVENANNFMEVEKLREKERESYIQTVLALAQTVDEKDSYTHGHLEDVTYYGMQVAEELQDSKEFKAVINKSDLETALRLHDIGKIGVPDAILHKNGNLTKQEWVIMKQHCEIGARIVEPIAKLKHIGDIIKHHQEKYDGTGYPDGLKGEEIPLESRIIAVVDSYHAMVSDRPYRKALPQEAALQELKNNIGTQFDPVVVGAFVTAWEKGKIKKA